MEDILFLSHPILCELCHLHRRNQIKTKFMQLSIYLNVVCQVRVWFLRCTWIRWVIRQFFRRVIWWQRGQGIRQNLDILLLRMDTLLFLCVLHFGFAACWSSRTCCLLLIQASISDFFFFFFCFFLCFPNSFVFSSRLFLMLKIFLSFLSPPHCTITTK